MIVSRSQYLPINILLILGFSSSWKRCILRPGRERHPCIIKYFSAQVWSPCAFRLCITLGQRPVTCAVSLAGWVVYFQVCKLSWCPFLVAWHWFHRGGVLVTKKLFKPGKQLWKLPGKYKVAWVMESIYLSWQLN